MRASRIVGWVGLVVMFAACGGDKVHHLPDGPTASACDQTACNATMSDGCCPSACNAKSDADCPAVCGNGAIEAGETCDPLATCPTDCPQIGCQLRTLDQPGTCGAACITGGTQTACLAISDGCCPAGCNATNDIDCSAVCDNGTLEPGEHCDPLSSCPTACPQQACQLYDLFDGNTCAAQCVAGAQQTACVNGDGCCPGACNANNDSDCTPVCNNGVVEAGESCDPLASCPTACAAAGCQLYDVQGTGCQAQCVAGGVIAACANDDNCCPAGCNANNDNDCAPGCGNNVVEPGETCDPVTSCPQSCPQQGCQLYSLDNPSTCQATCTPTAQQSACVNRDGCCPSGCDATTDSDCTPVCGNNVVEPGETCDPPGSCPTCAETYTCYTSTGSAASCDVQCHLPVNTCGIGADKCCAFDGAGCSRSTDRECTGPRWDYRRWNTDVALTAACTTLRVYNVQPAASYLFTTCSPGGTAPYVAGTAFPSGDSVITKVVDSATNQYNITNDDCGDPTALPNFAGWSCKNDRGAIRMSCASPSPGGFIVTAPTAPIWVEVTICPFGSSTGTVPFFIWYNAPAIPGPG